MSERSISHCQGKGSLAHNNRTFRPKNVDSSRTPDNITFIRKPIEKVYDKLFGAAVERYNARQKRSDRKIKTSYYEYQFNHKVSQSVITSADKRKSFYEDVVQIGTMNDTGIGTADAEIASLCLTEYMNGFQQRNPNFQVFNAVLHMDEATPHLHIDYIPVGHYKRGLDTQNGIAQALKEMGYGEGKNAIARWRQSEYEVLRDICIKHGLEISAPQKSRGSMTVEMYKEVKQLEEKLAPLRDLERIADNTEIPYKKYPLSKEKVIISKSDYDKISEDKKAAAIQIETARQETERNNSYKCQLDKRSAELDSREKQIDIILKDTEQRNKRAKSAENAAQLRKNQYEDLYSTQQNLNKLFNAACAERNDFIRKYNTEKTNNDELNKKINCLNETNSSLKLIIREKDKEIDGLNDNISNLKSVIKEKDTEIEKIRKHENVMESYCETLDEVGRYACKRLGVNYDKAVSMRIEHWNLSRCFGDSGLER